MTNLFKIKTTKRFTILSSCVVMVTIGAFFIANFTKTIQANAITAEGDSVTIAFDPEGVAASDQAEGFINFRSGWGSRKYLVQPNSGNNIQYTAFCIDPRTPRPHPGEYYTKDEKKYYYKAIVKDNNYVNNQIKLAIYIYTAAISHSDAEAVDIMGQWFAEGVIPNGWRDSVNNGNDPEYGMRNYQYIMIHALVGYINNINKADNDQKKDLMIEAWPNLNSDEQTWIQDRGTDLRTMIDNNSGIWQTAKKYKLYGLDMSELLIDNVLMQDIAWIEEIPYSISTHAVDSADQDQYIEASDNAQIIDTVDYCGEKGVTYTINGTIMDKSSKTPLKINGETITATISVTPTSSNGCGTVAMTFNLNASTLSGKDLVVFEDLYSGNDLLASHADFDDASQTISVISSNLSAKTPDTGATLSEKGSSDTTDKTMIFIIATTPVICTTIYLGARFTSRKKFFGKK